MGHFIAYFISLVTSVEDHGMPVDDGQFNLLTEKLGVADGGLSYLDFVTTLEGKVTLAPIQHEKILSWKIQNFFKKILL